MTVFFLLLAFFLGAQPCSSEWSWQSGWPSQRQYLDTHRPSETPAIRKASFETRFRGDKAGRGLTSEELGGASAAGLVGAVVAVARAVAAPAAVDAEPVRDAGEHVLAAVARHVRAVVEAEGVGGGVRRPDGHQQADDRPHRG